MSGSKQSLKELVNTSTPDNEDALPHPPPPPPPPPPSASSWLSAERDGLNQAWSSSFQASRHGHRLQDDFVLQQDQLQQLLARFDNNQELHPRGPTPHHRQSPWDSIPRQVTQAGSSSRTPAAQLPVDSSFSHRVPIGPGPTLTNSSVGVFGNPYSSRDPAEVWRNHPGNDRSSTNLAPPNRLAFPSSQVSRDRTFSNRTWHDGVSKYGTIVSSQQASSFLSPSNTGLTKSISDPVIKNPSPQSSNSQQGSGSDGGQQPNSSRPWRSQRPSLPATNDSPSKSNTSKDFTTKLSTAPKTLSASKSIGNNPPKAPSAPRAANKNGFRPMAAISHPPGQGPIRSNEGVSKKLFSPNYRGEHTLRNASNNDIPPEENCALWLTNLPASVTTQLLLRSIDKYGRIYCTVISPADFTEYTTSAAKVVFFTTEAAGLLLSTSLTKGVWCGGHKVRIRRNRVATGLGDMPTGFLTRVLIITGKSEFVNEASLTAYFRARFTFQIDEVIALHTNVQGRSVIEYKFGSHRCQAEMGKLALEKDQPEGFEMVEYGPDPCETGDPLGCFETAARRIQGKMD